MKKTHLSHHPDNKRSQVFILYVDDSHSMLELIKRFLEKDHQISVDTCSCPITASQIIFEKNPDLIISDYNMPNMNGAELLVNIRSSGKNIPFIIYSSHYLEEIDHQVFQLNNVKYLCKSGSISEQISQLHVFIKEMLQISQSALNPDRL